MDAPSIRYAETADGVKVAYWEAGPGHPLVQLPALPYSHIGAEWQIPELRRCYQLLAVERKLVRYDGRGIGLSQRDVSEFSLSTMLADLEAVVDAQGTERVALLGVINSASVACAYAARNPERVSHLLLWCPVVDASVHSANPQLQAFRRLLDADWDLYTQTAAHALLGWEESDAALRFAGFIRKAIDQPTAQNLVPAIYDLNVWDELSNISCPTLVMHRPNVPALSRDAAERLAQRIPGARLALMEGTSAVPYLGDWRAVVRTMYEFMGISRPDTGGPRALRLLSMRSDALTPRERQVVDLVVLGLTNQEIADRLYLSRKTVENHISRILVKLDLPSRTRLASYAVEQGLIDRPA